MNATAQSAATTQSIDPDLAWQQLLRRDACAPFFYGVTTTGVFCRPGCGSRRPLRRNVRFFATAADASRAGFRPCTRCSPAATPASPLDKIREHIEANLDRAVPLEELGRATGLSPFTVQRLFKQRMGVSPLQYRRALRALRLRSALKNGIAVTDAIYEAGFSSSSRAHEGARLGMKPSTYAGGGKGEVIRWANGPTPFGWIAIGSTDRGVCWLAFADKYKAESALRAEFPSATLVRDPALEPLLEYAVSEMLGMASPGSQSPQFDLKGTAFQLRVWEALRRIPRGETRSYSQVAAALGNAKATRAVARACATNRVAVLVPCHRVIGANGSETGYRWGLERKRALLEAEKASRKG